MASDDRQTITDIISSLTTAADSPGQTSALQQVLVAAGLLSGLLEVDSMILDRNGQVDIVLKGRFKGKNNFQNIL